MSAAEGKPILERAVELAALQMVRDHRTQHDIPINVGALRRPLPDRLQSEKQAAQVFVPNVLPLTMQHRVLKPIVRFTPIVKHDRRFGATPEHAEVRQSKKPLPALAKCRRFYLLTEQSDERPTHIVRVLDERATSFRLGPNLFHIDNHLN